MLAALAQSGLGECLQKALAPKSDFTSGPKKSGTVQQLLQTLLFLPVVGLHRPWDLRTYSGQALALLSGRERPYGYHYVESYLAELAKSRVGQSLTERLCRWTSQLWLPQSGSKAGIFYIDGHHKPVYSDKLLPRGLVGKLGKILPCRQMVLLHDGAGHPLLITTHRGDTHLTSGAKQAVELYERASPKTKVQTIIIDREGMAGEFLGELARQNRQVVTLLRQDQYRDLSSFREVGAFEAWQWDKTGKLTHRLAPASYRLKVGGGELELGVALMEDLRPKEREESTRLVPVVCTQPGIDCHLLAEWYRGRWQRQENIIKDWLLPIGLDINHGYTKTEVVNSEVSKRRTRLMAQLANCQKYEPQASQRSLQLARHYHHIHRQIYQLYQETERLAMRLTSQEFAKGREWREAQAKASQNEEICWRRERLEKLRAKRQHYWDAAGVEEEKSRKYRHRATQLEAELAELNQRERKMYQLDDQKDQIMTNFKLALVNLGMWLREHYFPPAYRSVTWERLLPFFRLDGWVRWEAEQVLVELKGFNDRARQRDLTQLCENLNAGQLPLADGRTLVLIVTDAKPALTNTTLAEAA